MDIIISANQEILAMLKSLEVNVSKEMDEEEYYEWLKSIKKDDIGNENRIQEVSV